MRTTSTATPTSARFASRFDATLPVGAEHALQARKLGARRAAEKKSLARKDKVLASQAMTRVGQVPYQEMPLADHDLGHEAVRRGRVLGEDAPEFRLADRVHVVAQHLPPAWRRV